MGKLVRDKINTLFEGRKVAATFTNGDDNFAEEILHVKLLEEAGELLLCKTAEEALKECSDVQAVLWAIADQWGISPAEIMAETVSKEKGRGGFNDLLIMEIEDGGEDKPEIIYREKSTASYRSYGGVGYSG